MRYGTLAGPIVAAAARNARGQARVRSTRSTGVNLVTFGALANGVGEASRVVGSLLADGHHQFAGYTYDVIGGDQKVELPSPGDPLFPVTLSALNAPDHVAAAAVFPRLYLPWRHRIGVWHWEVDVFPLLHRLAGHVTDEVWTTSRYQQELMAAEYGLPVHVLPLPVQLSTRDPELVAQIRGLLPDPGAFLFAFQFDWNSGLRRKNPHAVLSAYLQAFPAPRAGVALMLKSINSAQYPQDVAAFRAEAQGREDVVFIDDFWPTALNESFYHAVDCYVSLHRAEGFGLTMAKSMAAGKPVIATGFSGSMDFMDDRTAFLVPWQYVPVGPDTVYPAEARWAEPDIDVAADMMRTVADEPALREQIGSAAHESMLATRGRAQAVAWVTDRLGQIGTH